MPTPLFPMCPTSARRCVSYYIPSVLHTTEIYFALWFVSWFSYRYRDVHHTISLTFFAWYTLCFLYHWNILYTSHVKNCAPYYLSIKSPKKSCFIHIIEVMFHTYHRITNYCTGIAAIHRIISSLKLLIITQVSFIWCQHQRRKKSYVRTRTEILQG